MICDGEEKLVNRVVETASVGVIFQWTCRQWTCSVLLAISARADHKSDLLALYTPVRDSQICYINTEA
jgi:hypothetical protein